MSALPGSRRTRRTILAAALITVLVGAAFVVLNRSTDVSRLRLVAYFSNSNGIFAGDDVRIRGVTVGSVESIEPQPTKVKISFWIEDKYPVPADAKAVILSPTLVTSRAIQLTPPYRGGPVMHGDAVIPLDRTAVPIEFDDFRVQLEKLTETLQPTEPGGVSTLGEVVNTAADNLRGQGPAIRDAIVKLSQTISALGDNSDNTFTSVKNVAMLVSALRDSGDLLRHLNENLASVSGLLANDSGEVAAALKNFNEVVTEVTSFVAENQESLGTTSDKLASISTALHESLGDLEQLLHLTPLALDNLHNIYNPAQGAVTGAAAVNNFADPISFLCGAIQAASRMGAEQSAKLCVQYLAPIVKNRQLNFPPLGFNPFVGTQVRPNEVTYSEDWMRPDYIPPPPAQPAPPAATAQPPNGAPLAAEAPIPAPAKPADPAAGLEGIMVPSGAGS